MIRLKDVSKYYYNKGIIASGFTKINAEFNIGEFVVITGESGSGKSTLLNVLSGLDTYEEGEMYINGLETSHYSESDFEDYRKKYVSNIFQNFNLVNSYTVYQNIELVCLINGLKKREIKKRVIELIKKVDLYKYRNTKVSRLSGGQKQRVAIARALAKNTPIIIADEPTGNLDKTSALKVMKTLHDVSTEKLVIIVTHNYEQVMQYATRKITMFDGKIIEDKKILDVDTQNLRQTNIFKPMARLSELKLSFRNTFNIIPKFILLLAVFLFMIISIITEQATFEGSKFEGLNIGYNDFLNELSRKRIILNKINKDKFTEEDYLAINNLTGVDYIVKNDLELDNSAFIYNDEYYLYGKVKSINSLNIKLDYGRYPENDNEIVLVGGPKDYYYLKDINSLLNQKYSLYDANSFLFIDKNIKIVGIKIDEDLDYEFIFYAKDKIVDKLNNYMIMSKNELNIKINNNTFITNIIPLESIPEGKVYLSSNMNYLCKYTSCYNEKVNINIKNMYYENNIDLVVSKVLSKSEFKKLIDLDYDEYSNYLYINAKDYNSLITDDIYQISVFVKDDKKIDDTIKELKQKGYNTYAVKDLLVNYNSSAVYMLNIINVIVTIILLVVMFIISYLIIKLILKSRQVYFTTLRILGANTKNSRRILENELFIVLNIACIIVAALIILINKDIIHLKPVKEILSFVGYQTYILIYIVLFIMTYLISLKFAGNIFKKSAMKTINEEV